MIYARQSTAIIVTVGPVLDADGVAVTDGVVGDFKASKNGGAPAALNGSATLTHRNTGHYSLSLTTTDVNTVGTLEIVIDDTVNACPVKEITVLEEVIYDALFAGSANAFSGAAGSTTLTALATGSITAAVVATGAIDADAIADNAIDAGAIASDAITAAKIATGAITAAKFAAGAIDAAALAADAGTEIATAVWASGTRTLTSLSGLTVDTVTTLTNLPTIPANWLTAAGTAADFGTEVGTAVWATAARTLTAATNITSTGSTLLVDGSGNVQVYNLTVAALNRFVDTDTGLLVGDAVAGSVAQLTGSRTWEELKTDHTNAGTFGDYLDTEVSGVGGGTAADIADAVWDEVLAGHAGVGSAGAALSAAGGSGDPWSTALPGAYGSGTAGFIVDQILDRVLLALPNVAAGANGGLPLGDASGDVTVSSLTLTALNQFADTDLGITVGDMAAGSVAQLTASRAWEEPKADHTNPDTYGDYLDDEVSSRSSHSAADVVTALGTGATLTTLATQTSVNDLPTNAELTTALDALPTAAENADALLGRNVAGGSSTGRTVSQAFFALRNKVAFDTPTAGSFTVYATDDTTSSWTGTYTTDAGAEPVVSLDPS